MAAIGDVIMALSMLEAIDRNWRGARVTWICGKSVEPLLRQVSRIDELIVLDDQQLLKGGLRGALSQLIPLWLKLLGRRFDLVVTGHSDERYRFLSLTAQGRLRRSFGNHPEGRWPVPGRFHADEYARLITGINGPDASFGVLPVIPAPLRTDLAQKFQAGKRAVVLAPGGARNVLRDDNLRRWPIENYAALAQKLIQKGFQVVLTGASSDEWVREFFSSLPVLDLIGQTSILDMVAVYGAADLIITHDSGPLHLAVLSGKPIVALFGPTMPMEKLPKQERIHVLWGGESLACRPCYDGKNYAECADNQCLKKLSVSEVYETAIEALGKIKTN